MSEYGSLGKTLIVVGLTLALLGVLVLGGGKFLHLGRLPGDIVIKRGNFTLFFPLATGIVLSLVLTVLLNLLFRR